MKSPLCNSAALTYQDSEENTKKMALMKDAIKDPLFLQDMKEVQEDFKYIDSERGQYFGN